MTNLEQKLSDEVTLLKAEIINLKREKDIFFDIDSMLKFIDISLSSIVTTIYKTEIKENGDYLEFYINKNGEEPILYNRCQKDLFERTLKNRILQSCADGLLKYYKPKT